MAIWFSGVSSRGLSDISLKEQIQCYTAINGALEIQRTYYTAYKAGKEGRIKKPSQISTSRYPKLKMPLKKTPDDN